ncbi:MAG TPA: RNA polymerase sigma factor [Planctomycetota bacterium]|nr:RNA polymerase sigma factor [Planctomycetota bacterium]
MSETTRLVDAACAGDRGALESLYAQHRGRLVAFIRSRMSDELAQRVSPEDIVQETLLESSRKIDAFVPQGGSSFYRWLVGIARNKLLEANRARLARKRALEAPLEIDLGASQTSPSGRAMRAEGAIALHQALAALPERQAEAVRCRYLEGLSLAETAERLACSEPAVKALVSRGLTELAGRILPRDAFG